MRNMLMDGHAAKDAKEYFEALMLNFSVDMAPEVVGKVSFLIRGFFISTLSRRMLRWIYARMDRRLK